MRLTLRLYVSVLAILGVLAWVAPGHAQEQPEALAPTFGECEAAVDDAALRDEVLKGARSAMGRATSEIDFADMVRRSWGSVRFDSQFASIVDSKIEILRADRPYLSRLLDGNVPSRAREMAERTADLVFNSAEFNALQQELQGAVGTRLEPLVSRAGEQAESQAARCIQLFLGTRYALTIQQAFASESEEAELGGDLSTRGVSASAALSMAGVVAAMLALVFRRLIRRIVRSIVQRLAGAIAARLASWVSGVVGAVALVYELVAGAEGVFPIIRDELVSPDTRAEMQAGLVQELQAIGPQELDKRAEQIAAEMFSRWRSFKEDHAALLALADTHPRFKTFVEDQGSWRFEGLTTAVAALQREGGEPAVLDALDRGVLTAALRVPEMTRHLDQWSGRGLAVEDLVNWHALAGSRFDRVMALEIPAVARPADLSRDDIEALVAVDNRRAVQAVAALPETVRSDALRLGPERLRRLATRVEGPDLHALFSAVGAVPDPSRRTAVIERVAAEPGLARHLRSGGASAVASSGDPGLALDTLLDARPIWNPFAAWELAEAVGSGAINPMVPVYRYGWWLTILVLPVLIAFGMVRWFVGLFMPRRRTVVREVIREVHVPVSAPHDPRGGPPHPTPSSDRGGSRYD